METNELLNIKIKAAGKIFPLEINREEEESYRIAEQILNTKVAYYQSAFGDLERHEVLSMAAYDIAVCFMRYITKNYNSEYFEELEKLLAN